MSFLARRLTRLAVRPAAASIQRRAVLSRAFSTEQGKQQEQQQEKQQGGGGFKVFAAVTAAAGAAAAVYFTQNDNSKKVAAPAAHTATANASTVKPQPTVVSGGTEHAGYLWIHLSDKANGKECAKIAAHVQETVGKINEEVDTDSKANVGVAFGPKFWKSIGGATPENFDYKDRRHTIGNMPATGGDIFFHVKSNSYGVCFDSVRSIVDKFPAGSIARIEDNYGFVYRSGRDLSGFIDGTENPATEETRIKAALVQDDKFPGASFLITQRWVHQFDAIKGYTVAQQEGFIGRSKDNSVQMEDNVRPKTSHVSRMVGHHKSGEKINIVRQSMPYTRGEDSGLFFIAYARSPSHFDFMLDRMTGQAEDKLHDDTMRLTKCISGNYWYVPSPDQLKAIA